MMPQKNSPPGIHMRRPPRRWSSTADIPSKRGASAYHDVVPANALGYRTVLIARHGETSAVALRVLPDLARLPETIAELERA